MGEYGWMVELLICGHSSALIQANHVNYNQLHLVCWVHTSAAGMLPQTIEALFSSVVIIQTVLCIMSGYYWLMLFIIDMGKAACPYPDPNNISLVHLGHKRILDLLQLCWRCLERKGKRAWWDKEGVKFDGGTIICFALMRVKEWPHSKHRHTSNPYTQKKCLHTSCLIKSSGSELFRANMANAIHQNSCHIWLSFKRLGSVRFKNSVIL